MAVTRRAYKCYNHVRNWYLSHLALKVSDKHTGLFFIEVNKYGSANSNWPTSIIEIIEMRLILY